MARHSQGAPVPVSKEADEAVMGRLPLLDSARVYSSWAKWIFAAFVYGAAAWSLLTGGALGAMLPPGQAFAALLLGQTVALAVCVLFTGMVSGRYGIDTIDAARPAFGIRGAQVVTVLVFFAMTLSIMAVVSLLGAALDRFSELTLGIVAGKLAVGGVCVVLIALAVVFASLGPHFFARVWNWAVVPVFVVLTVVMLVALVVHFGIDGLFAMRPPVMEDGPTGMTAFMMGVEVGAGMGFAYWTSTGTLFRLVRSPRVAIHGSMIGWAFLTVPVIGAGIFAALGFGSHDPTVWMYELMGSVGGALAIVFIVVANVSCIVTMFYICSVVVRQTPAMARVPAWTIMTALGLPALLAAFWPDEVIAAFPAIVGYIGLATIPVVAVLTVDYFVLRHMELDLRHIFTHKPGTKYWFWKGVNPAAFAAVVAAVVTFQLIYNPLTYEYHAMFPYVSASLPAFVVAAVTYWALTRAFIAPRGLGGYSSGRQSRAVPVGETDISL